MLPSISFGSDDVSLSAEKSLLNNTMKTFDKHDHNQKRLKSSFHNSKILQETDPLKPTINRHHDVNTSGDSDLNIERTISEGVREIGTFNFKPTRSKLPLVPYLQLQQIKSQSDEALRS